MINGSKSAFKMHSNSLDASKNLVRISIISPTYEDDIVTNGERSPLPMLWPAHHDREDACSGLLTAW